MGPPSSFDRLRMRATFAKGGSVETLILLADNDAEGRRARDRAAETYRRPGLAIETEWPPGRMNDWAQLLKR